jgi:hypothetical protein
MEVVKMPDREYHAIKDRCSASVLKSLRKSPAHMKAGENAEQSDSMALGSLFHCMTLEPEELSARYIKAEKFDRRTTAGKIAAEKFAADNKDKIIVDPDDWEKADIMADSARSHSKAGKLLDAAALTEGVVLFEIDGVLCKAKIDLFAHGFVIDLKSTKDASPESFQRDFVKYGYHVQGAFYRRAARAAGLDCRGFAIIATENAAPFCSAVYELSENALRLGDQLINKLLPVWQECRQTDQYPGYPEIITTLDLPAWELKNLDDKPAMAGGIIQF